MGKPLLAALLSCASTSLSDTEKHIFSKSNPVGITLFSRNIENKNQVQKLVKEIKETIGRNDILIAVDQEGGRVRRLKEPEFRTYASQTDIGSLSLDAAQTTADLHARLISADLRELGINVNFSPVLDICRPQTTEALRSRCFSSQPQTVAVLGKTMIEAYLASGILPCIKHMPGHGLAVSDPHLGLPVIDVSLKRLQTELIPFSACSTSPLGMTAHILLPAIDKDNPVTQSTVGIKTLIRDAIGFNGLLISDAIDMKALKGTVVDKAKKSLVAGCDIVCYCMAQPDELAALAKDCPQLSDEAQERLDKAVQILHNTPIPSCTTAAMAARYAELIGKTVPYKESYDATEVLHQLKQRK